MGNITLSKKEYLKLWKAALNDFIDKRDIKRKEISDITDTAESNIGDYLNIQNDTNFFTTEKLVRIADYYNVSLDDLLGRKVSQKSEESSFCNPWVLLLELQEKYGFTPEETVEERYTHMCLVFPWICIDEYGTRAYEYYKEFNEWINMLNVFKTMPDNSAREKLYALWKNDFLERTNPFPFGKPNNDEEMPFH